ncbi:RNA binding motif protein, X-linked-like-1, partial [Tetrabaena socialis]
RSRSPAGAKFGLPPAGRTPPRVGTQLFVAGINFICNEQDLEQKFSRYGRVREARVVRHPSSGESRGFAFVGMSAESEAEEAVRDMNGRDWNGRRLLVEVAKNPR